MTYNSPTRGQVEISTMNEWDLKYHIRQFRQERDLAQRGGALQNFARQSELAEMEKTAAAKGWKVE